MNWRITGPNRKRKEAGSMRVCLLNDSFPPVIDGVVNVVMNYAKIMSEQNLAEVMVGTPRYPEADYSCYPYRVVPYKSFDTTALVSGYRAGNPFAAKAVEEMTLFAPDVIHTHCPVASTVMARILRNETKAPVIFTYHTKFDIDIARAVKAKFLQKESIKALVDNIAACDEVWVVSRGAGQNLVSLGYEGEYRVMNNGVDFPKGRVADDIVEKATKDYLLPPDVPVFLYVGRMINYKGLPLILDAMKQLNATGMNFRMVFVGGGPDAEELKQNVRDFGLFDKVIFTGPIYDREILRAWNTRADLFLFPSTYDTNGIVVREAAACGLASVLVRDSCAAEGITDARNGFLIEENATDMARRLGLICQDLNYIHQVGKNAMDEIYISWEDAVWQAHDRYESLIDLKKCGYLTRRKYQTSDYFLNIATGLTEVAEKVTHAPKRFYEGMQENVRDMSDTVTAGMKNFSAQLHDTRNNVVSWVKDKLDPESAERREQIEKILREEPPQKKTEDFEGENDGQKLV